MKTRSFILGLIGALMVAPLWAQERAAQLADIRADLSALYGQIQSLKSELAPSNGAQAPAISGSVIDRVTLIESELQRLTAKTEELEYRIERVVKDGTNRIGDLEFRLVELEGGDVSTLSETSTLGGAAPAASVSAGATATAQSDADEPELAVSEEADFARADDAFASGDFAAAAVQFGTFAANYPAGPLTDVARYKQGMSQKALGDHRAAASTFLETYRAAPNSEVAPAALVELGAALGKLGKKEAACTTLGQARARYSDAELTAQIASEMSALSCP